MCYQNKCCSKSIFFIHFFFCTSRECHIQICTIGILCNILCGNRVSSCCRYETLRSSVILADVQGYDVRVVWLLYLSKYIVINITKYSPMFMYPTAHHDRVMTILLEKNCTSLFSSLPRPSFKANFC